ncbi:unnamed protein product [Adineta ricciae]|uniref:Small RNA 2'-O-methyltransferase n=1 Tax=Adineta ricciae TaxID=249248 RepID=A0A814MGK0_ADIRI|nr:unnamed protein product [Adineta ricciae]CAF1079228.1 unnamed protein product [Adineta ricciae]
MATVETKSTESTNHPEKQLSTHHIPDHEGEVHFTPPLYRQRYQFALDIIQNDPSLYSLLDIGCGTCQLLTIGKYRNPHIQLAAAIDIVRYQLDEACFRLKPLPVEYISFRRETPLHMYILHGDATKVCNCFYNFDVVTLIEVIEHLYINDLENLITHVFGYIRPRLVIVSTPNADFNVLFSTMPCGQFRHMDHKFEFTRQQFCLWAQQIAVNYNYLVEFSGVGEAPPSERHRDVGACTQIAIFYQQEMNPQSSLTSNELFQRLSYCKQHEVVSLIDYPYGIKKTTEIHEQIRYILEMYRLVAQDKARHGDDNHDTFPLTINCQTLLHHPRLVDSKLTLEELKQIIGSIGYKLLDHDRIILAEDLQTHPHEDDHEHEHCSTNHSNDFVKNTRHNSQNEESWD